MGDDAHATSGPNRVRLFRLAVGVVTARAAFVPRAIAPNSYPIDIIRKIALTIPIEGQPSEQFRLTLNLVRFNVPQA